MWHFIMVTLFPGNLLIWHRVCMRKYVCVQVMHSVNEAANNFKYKFEYIYTIQNRMHAQLFNPISFEFDGTNNQIDCTI